MPVVIRVLTMGVKLKVGGYNSNMEIGKVINGYLRLYCAIFGIPKIPKRCRVCGAELDTEYQKRDVGFLCLDCFRTQNRNRAREYYKKHRGT